MKHKSTLFYIFIIIACILLMCAGVLIFKAVSERREMSQADDAIETIKEQVISYEDEQAAKEEDPLKRVIDFDALLAINDDVAFWLYIPDTPIDYPVMAVPDGNEYYLTHDINGDTGSWGSLFSYKSSCDSDMSIVYGHHVTGYEPAFGELEDYMKQDFAEEHSTAYVYLPGGSIEIYELYAVLDTTTGDMVYAGYYYRDSDEWDALITHLKENSVYDNGDDDAEADDLLMLSTCKEYATLKRYAVIFVFGSYVCGEAEADSDIDLSVYGGNRLSAAPPW